MGVHLALGCSSPLPLKLKMGGGLVSIVGLWSLGKCAHMPVRLPPAQQLKSDKGPLTVSLTY